MVMPSCLGLSGSVRTVAKPRLQYAAPVVHTFWPLTSQPPSTLVARVRTPAASEPAPGSLNSWHHTYSCSRLRADPALDLVGVGVLGERLDDPAADPVLRPPHAGGGELLVDHELLDRARRRGPTASASAASAYPESRNARELLGFGERGWYRSTNARTSAR